MKLNTVRPHSCLAALIALATYQVQAQSVEVKWGSEQRFARSVNVVPSKPFEFCTSLAAGQKLVWSFEASQELEYTVYSVDDTGKNTLSPTATGWKFAGKIGKPSGDARYCWSWTNATTKPIELAFDVKRDP